MNELNRDALSKMREPFPDHQIGHMQKGGSTLDFVGHAALTSRLLDADLSWTWEPMSTDAQGLPAFDRDANGQPIGLWIRLTIGGVTRLGYGDAGGKTGGNAVKEIIGDALRNAGMRFGAALDLWHKGGDLDGGDRQDETRHQSRGPDPLASAREAVLQAGKRRNMDLGAQATAYAEWSGGEAISTATPDQLLAFAGSLNTGKPASLMPPKDVQTNGHEEGDEKAVASILAALEQRESDTPRSYLSRVTKARVDVGRYNLAEHEVEGIPLNVVVGNALADATAALQ